MEKTPRISIAGENPFDAQAQEFAHSRLFRRLQNKYAPKPFEETFAPMFYLSLAVSYLANGLSILTGFAWLFDYAYALIARLPYAAQMSAILALVLLGVLEAFQRFMGLHFFRMSLQYGFSGPYASRLYGMLAGMVLAAGVSVYISYYGGFQFMEFAAAPPQRETPALEDVPALEAGYQKLIASAEREAENYRRSKLYRNRLSDQHAARYRELLREKNRLVQEMLHRKTEAETRNRRLSDGADRSYQAALAEHEAGLRRKGVNLGHFTICFIVLLHLCLWYMEYFDFRTASQYALKPAAASSPGPSPTPPQAAQPGGVQSQVNGHTSEGGPGARPVILGFRHPPAGAPPQPVLEHVSTPIPGREDIYTILHYDFNTGAPKRYGIKDIDNFIADYELRLREAQEQRKKESVVRNRQNRLSYWQSRRRELEDKIRAAELG